jgi:YD repeat-containing protein
VYTWDAANRLVSANVDGVASSFEYDGSGNRTAQTVGGVTTESVLDVAGGLPEVWVATTGGASTRYVQVQARCWRSRTLVRGRTSYQIIWVPCANWLVPTAWMAPSCQVLTWFQTILDDGIHSSIVHKTCPFLSDRFCNLAFFVARGPDATNSIIGSIPYFLYYFGRRD